METLDAEEESISEGSDVVNANQRVSIENLSFGYKPDELVLHDISFQMEPGTVTAVVGPSGGGKTTLFSMLERFTYRKRTDPIG